MPRIYYMWHHKTNDYFDKRFLIFMHYNVLQWHNGTKMASKIIGAEYQGCINCSILPSGMGARGVSSEHVENTEMFSCSPSWCALILRELNQIFIACLFKGSQEQFFFRQTLLFTAFLVTVLEILTYALVSSSSLVSSRWEHVKWKMHPCWVLWWCHYIILV